jgi:quercetin dioxygenase-like cupin family protein
MNIKRNGSQASGKGNTDWFTGTVRIDQPFQAEEPARVGGATVTFCRFSSTSRKAPFC